VQPVGSETCPYRTAAQKVNNSKRIVTDRLNDFSLWNYYCQLNEKKFDLSVAVQRDVTPFDIYEK